MSNDIDYGKLTKKIVFTENDHRQAKLITKLRQDGLTQSKFFRHMVTAYLDEDERIVSYVDEIKQQSKSRKTKTKRLRDQGNQAIDDLGLTEQQVVDIFDLIAKEHPDL
tara:strand:- start:101 stop:427 length:327 start_codon:yes stop_codon:yes gene_type:complete